MPTHTGYILVSEEGSDVVETLSRDRSGNLSNTDSGYTEDFDVDM